MGFDDDPKGLGKFDASHLTLEELVAKTGGQVALERAAEAMRTGADTAWSILKPALELALKGGVNLGVDVGSELARTWLHSQIDQYLSKTAGGK